MPRKGANVAAYRESPTEDPEPYRGPGHSWGPDAAAEDIRLLRGVAAGESASLARLYERRGGALYSLLVRMLANEAEAEELLQDTFVRIWRRAGDFDPARSAPFTWMVMIARGLALSRLRSRGRAATGMAAYEQELASLEVEHVSRGWHTADPELPALCAGALRQLPEPQRRALELAFFRGWTHVQIARATGEPLGTVKARIRRGLLSLRGLLKDFHA
jgi:RNA polymerase sigma-70 factor (ECF subfamily)